MSTALEVDPHGLTDATEVSPAAPSIAQKTEYRTVEDFVAHVIYDGRFIDSFTTDPGRTAESLGVALAPDVIESLRNRDRGEVLAETTEKMTQIYGERKRMVDPTRPEILADFGIVIGAAIGGTVVVTIVCVFFGQATMVEDHSEDAGNKL